VARASSGDSGEASRVLLLPLIHGRARLLILSFLLRCRRAVSFTELRKGVGFTDGTLSVHLSKLQEGEMVQVEKTYEGKRPLTLIKVTAKGRRQFRQYINDLVDIVPGLGDS
jgi:DNA-binding transcriptional ArsR family regulator